MILQSAYSLCVWGGVGWLVGDGGENSGCLASPNVVFSGPRLWQENRLDNLQLRDCACLHKQDNTPAFKAQPVVSLGFAGGGGVSGGVYSWRWLAAFWNFKYWECVSECANHNNTRLCLVELVAQVNFFF